MSSRRSQQVRRDAPVALRLHLAYAASPESAPASRTALRAFLQGTALQDRAEDAALALSELVTNAVLHGRAPITVALWCTGDLLRVEVGDTSPVSPTFSMLDPTAVTGRGLVIVTALADAWGTLAAGDEGGPSKAVWFEMRRGERQDAADDVDALLAAWGDDLEVDPAHEQVRVVLTDLDTVLVARSEAHVEALLRELSLVAGGAGTPDGDGPSSGDDPRHLAREVLSAAARVDALRVDLRRQLSLALAAGQPLVDLTVTVQRDQAEAVRLFAEAVEQADRLSRSGDLLMAPVPVELSELRAAYLRRLLAQLLS